MTLWYRHVVVHECETLWYTHMGCRGTCMQDTAEPLWNIWCHTCNCSDHCSCKCCWGNKTNTKHHIKPMSYKVQLHSTCAECLSACLAHSFLLFTVPCITWIVLLVLREWFCLCHMNNFICITGVVLLVLCEQFHMCHVNGFTYVISGFICYIYSFILVLFEKTYESAYNRKECAQYVWTNILHVYCTTELCMMSFLCVVLALYSVLYWFYYLNNTYKCSGQTRCKTHESADSKKECRYVGDTSWTQSCFHVCVVNSWISLQIIC